tara:strand:- start:861 stop:968 length:108 start_codon:yes stop_codon:yes gene_type:complete
MIDSILIQIPVGAHGLLEFAFFVGVGITASSIGII